METPNVGRNYPERLLIRHDRHRLPAEPDRAGTFTRRHGAKPTVEKTLNRAGATPLFGRSAAQKFRGIAPALAAHVIRAAWFFHGLGEKQETI
jgi:hypothetical protein